MTHKQDCMQYQTFKILTDEVKAQILTVWDDYQQTVKAEKDADTGTFEVVATTEDTDRDGEVIRADGWDFEPYKKNPIVLWAHNFYDMPIGKVTEIIQEGNRIIAKGVFAPTEKAQEVRKVYDGKFLNTVSVGFIPREREMNIITRAELLELSFVPVPANPNAIAIRRAVEELSAKMMKNTVNEETKTEEEIVVSTNSEKVSPEEMLPAMEAIMERLGADVAGMVVQAKQEIATVIGEEKKSEEEEIVKESVSQLEVKVGRVLSSSNRKLIGGAIEALEPAVAALKDLLTATDPDGDKALNQNQTPESTDSEKAIAINRQDLVLAAIRAADKALGLTLRELKSDRDK